MNNPFDQISGQIIIKGRVYSAKEVIRGLLEQGIAITEGSEGLKIGFKLFSPESESSQNTFEGNQIPNCPFIPYMSQITSQLENLASRLNNQHNTEEYSPLNSPFPPPKAEDQTSSAFSPFNTSLFQSKDDDEKDQFFRASSSFYENRQKCPSCGATIPQNAFFCNKCGKHVRSG
ncbi:MAG: zinc ribbon domain-containing protein [Candidatus Thorarchaeota archaeon]